MSDSSRRFETIRRHFEAEAADFDKNFFRVAPTYHDAIGVIVSALPFRKGSRPEILDLGCGTGNITRAVKERYPDARITCVDLSENMLRMARAKLKGYRDISYWKGDIRAFDYSKKFDAIVGSLVLHHVDEREKGAFYKKLHSGLHKNGVFYNADVVLGATPHIQNVYLTHWIDYMKKSLTPSQIRMTLKNHRLEDRPCRLMTELGFLREAGFREVDVLWKNHYFAVYGGVRRRP